jgi:hypothetical protein
MFVRWQRYRSQARNSWCARARDSRSRLKAILVESARVDGNPRQKHVAFLGSIESDGLGKPADRGMLRFWSDVTAKLKRLGNRVALEDCERIMASIAAKVGARPTDAELEQFDRECEKFRRGL